MYPIFRLLLAIVKKKEKKYLNLHEQKNFCQGFAVPEYEIHVGGAQ
jgi:hypothetical protein